MSNGDQFVKNHPCAEARDGGDIRSQDQAFGAANYLVDRDYKIPLAQPMENAEQQTPGKGPRAFVPFVQQHF